jgi:hypothetical protein
MRLAFQVIIVIHFATSHLAVLVDKFSNLYASSKETHSLHECNGQLRNIILEFAIKENSEYCNITPYILHVFYSQ